MVVLWYLLVLAPFIVIPILWWIYRRRQAAREQVAGARWQSLVKEAAAPPAGSAVEPPVIAVVPAPVIPLFQATAARYVQRERMLDPVQTVLYYLLKNSLADHEIMPQAALGSIVSVPAEISGSQREQRMRALSREIVDFVICDKKMKPVAVIDLLAQEAPAALTTAPDFRTQCLAQTGIRHLCLVRTALPKREELRGLVLGA